MQPFRSFINVRDMTQPEPAAAPAIALAYDLKALARPDLLRQLQEQFQEVRFRPLHETWFAEALKQVDLVIAALDATSPAEVDRFCVNIRESGRPGSIIVVLANAGIEVTRQLMREGVGDVLVAPTTDAAVAISLERVMGALAQSQGGGSGQVISLLKSGGGVGATALGVQLAAQLAQSGVKVCVVDLDVQFGAAAMYLDLRNTVTMGEVLSSDANPADIRFAQNLAAHSSGARVLAAPREFMPLEAISSQLIDDLLSALRRDFEIVLLDLPSAWTAWTSRALRLSDRILLVSQLSVAHAHQTRRQISLLQAQGLEDIPLTLICNRFGAETLAGVNRRSVETAIGRGFDVLLPEDGKLMGEAINQGVALGSLRRGTKLGKALEQLAAQVAPVRQQAKAGGR